jgi:hypothetical protein
VLGEAAGCVLEPDTASDDLLRFVFSAALALDVPKTRLCRSERKIECSRFLTANRAPSGCES